MNAMTTPTTMPAAMTFARAYQLLGLAFAYPGQDLSDSIANGDLHSGLVTASRAAIPPGLAPDMDGLQVVRPATALAAEYLSAFELAKNTVSLYEGSYTGGSDRSQILLEVKSFYLHFGLSVSELLREPEDHLAAELEFMQFLTAKQALAEMEGEDPGPYIRAQRDFLSRHLGKWLPAFTAAANGLESDFYRVLANVANALVTAHQDLLTPASGDEAVTS
ncbi:MAG: molecular chaperone TorD family protein [Magnetospirillum sp.]|nr:molecular chaperone TorD family protein [Magnetospirillum sp.]